MAVGAIHNEKESMSGGGSAGRTSTPRSDDLKENLTEMGTNLRQAVSNAVPAAQEQIQRAGTNVADTRDSVEAYLTECIQEKPLSSVLVAAALGMFAGALFLRR